eukprot:8509824-Heterocapsa_arctica.AAC.1
MAHLPVSQHSWQTDGMPGRSKPGRLCVRGNGKPGKMILFDFLEDALSPRGLAAARESDRWCVRNAV